MLSRSMIKINFSVRINIPALWGIDAHPHLRLLQLQRGSRNAPRAPLGLLHRSSMFSVAPSALSRLQYAPESCNCNSNRAPTGLLQLQQGSYSSNRAPAAPMRLLQLQTAHTQELLWVKRHSILLCDRT